MRLIDADELIKAVEKERIFIRPYDDPFDVVREQGKRLKRCVMDAPTVGAVPPEIRVLLEALRKLDLSCDYCAHRGNPHEDCDGECQTCSHDDCRCGTCRDNSNWEWSGENHG